MNILSKIRNSKYLDYLYGLLIIGIVFLLFARMPEIFYYWQGHLFLYNNIPRLITLFVLIMCICLVIKFRQGSSVELKLWLAFIVFNVISQAYNGSLRYGGIVELFICDICFLAVGFYLKNLREKVFAVCSVIFCLVLSAISVAALVMLFNISENIGVFTGKIWVEVDYVRYLKFFYYHRNISAGWFLIGIFLAFYGLVTYKNIIIKVLSASIIPFFFIILTVQHCRSIYITLAVACAMVAGICVFHFSKKKFVFKLLIASVLAIICAFACYKGITVTDNLISNNTAPIDSGEGSQLELKDDRDFIGDLTHFTGRTKIWKSGIDLIKKKPVILLFGQSQDTYMDGILFNGKERPLPWNHMHNFLFQALMISGLPSMLCLVAFVVIFIYRGIKYCIFIPNALTLSQKLLFIPPSSMILYGMMEPFFNEEFQLITAFYMLVFGLFIEYCREADKASLIKSPKKD